jgi:hypothetical protein
MKKIIAESWQKAQTEKGMGKGMKGFDENI